jgi:hypothetical protein
MQYLQYRPESLFVVLILCGLLLTSGLPETTLQQVATQELTSAIKTGFHTDDAHDIAVTIDGVRFGIPGETYPFTATVTGASPSEPISYLWEPEPQSGQGTATPSYTFESLDAYYHQRIYIDVTVTTASGSITGRHHISLTNAVISPKGATIFANHPWSRLGEWLFRLQVPEGAVNNTVLFHYYLDEIIGGDPGFYNLPPEYEQLSAPFYLQVIQHDEPVAFEFLKPVQITIPHGLSQIPVCRQIRLLRRDVNNGSLTWKIMENSHVDENGYLSAFINHIGTDIESRNRGDLYVPALTPAACQTIYLPAVWR